MDAARRSTGLTVIASVAVLVLDTITPLNLAVWLLQVILVWIATLWAGRRQLLALAMICATFIALGYCLSHGTEQATWVDRCNALLAFGTVAALTRSRLRQMSTDAGQRKSEHDFTHDRETVSRDLLPICAWCKKIRNESGNWEQPEIYIHKHSKAELTHGICQECATRLIPETTVPYRR